MSSIKQVKKPCFGLLKAKGNGCGKPTLYRKNGLCRRCWPKWYFSTEEGQKRVIAKAKKNVNSELKKADKKRKDKVTKWDQKLQIQVNKIVRLIDKNQPCLARGYTKCQFQAGHIWTRGAHSGAKYHLDNIHRQSAQSNKWQNDDHLLREGLKAEYGQEYYDYVEGLKNTLKLDYSNEDYRLFTIKAREIVRRFEKEGKTYSTIERLKLRKEINDELGIYK